MYWHTSHTKQRQPSSLTFPCMRSILATNTKHQNCSAHLSWQLLTTFAQKEDGHRFSLQSPSASSNAVTMEMDSYQFQTHRYMFHCEGMIKVLVNQHQPATKDKPWDTRHIWNIRSKEMGSRRAAARLERAGQENLPHGMEFHHGEEDQRSWLSSQLEPRNNPEFHVYWCSSQSLFILNAWL